MTALYVGNLHTDCTEATLYRKFAPIGSILNIRICRDTMSGNSLGYGYVNFAHKEDAEDALNCLNYDPVKGQAMRIMWASKRYAENKFPEEANLFVKNLHHSIDERALYDIFACYGNILSLKIATYETGESKGYAFIQFEEERSAEAAIKEINEKLVCGKKVFITKFVPRSKREIKLGETYRNIYLKNFSRNFDDKDLKNLCEIFGTIMSAKVMTDEKGESRGFGFVCFEDSESAAKAVKELNGKTVDNQKIFVGRAKKKSERQAEVLENFRRKLKFLDS